MRNFARPQSIAFVDKNVPDAAKVMAGLCSDIKVLLDPERDAIAQITETLRSYRNIKSLSVISHGNMASLGFGGGALGAVSLPQYSSELRLWRDSLAPGADILLYGCNVAQGEDGRSFVDLLSAATGADVAASTDVTGAASRGGDWVLEYATGRIESPSAVTASLAATYRGLLAPGVLALSGTPTQNQTLAANVTDIEGVPAVAIIYQWQQSSDNGANWSNIADASGRAFTLQQAQVGQLVRATASYTDAANNQERIEGNPTTAIVNVNDAGVASITGTPVQGQTLIAAVTDLDGLVNVIVSYRWQQLIGTTWSNISGATGPSWTLQAAQVGRQVRVRATYTDRLLTSESNRTSAPTPVIVSSNADGNDAGVVSLSGTPTQNQTLSANVTDVDGLPSGTPISYQWQQLESSGWTDIAGAAGRSLPLQQTQVGKQVRVLASYSDALGGSEQRVNSTSSATIANVNEVGVPSVTGAPIRGGTLTAAVADADGLPTPSSISYQWQQLIGTTWSSISGATGPSYVLQPAQVGRQVRVRASYTDLLASSETNRVSGPTPVITNPNNILGTISVTGTPTQSQVLTATVSDTDGLPATINYQWQQSSNGGTSWTAISGATARTLTLGQAQVQQHVRATASYTDSQGNAENVTSTATAIANVNDVGAVAISGIPTHGQTLTATVTDADGIPNTINYQWQQRNDSASAWVDITGATAQALTLQAAQVGKQVSVTAHYMDVLGGDESVASAPTSSIAPLGASPISIYTTQTPSQPNFTDGDNWEYGTRFSSSQPGVIQAVRYWKAASETGTHVGRVWSSTGQQLASVTFTDDTGSGWKQQTLDVPLAINAGTTYVVSVNANSYAAFTSNGFASPITNGPLSAPVGAGVYNANPGSFPTLVFQNENYFRDVVFTAGTQNPNNNPGSVAVTGTPTQNQVLTATVSDADGPPATINYQWQQSSNGTNWTAISGATARTLTLQQAQVNAVVRATATYVDSLGNPESVTSIATAAIVNVNDPGSVAISGIPTQGQTLTADVTDLDGLAGVSIAYQWHESSNGTNWTEINGATARTLALQQAQVGQQVRVTAGYADALGSTEKITSSPTSPISSPGSNPISIFTNQTPSQSNFTDGPGVDWEYGMKFSSTQPGVIQAVRYYKAPSETGAHVGRIWSAAGVELASTTFTNETGSGWQQQSLSTPLAIDAGTTYVVSVNANSYYAVTSNGFASPISNGSLTAPVGAGVYNANPGSFPTQVYQNESYFRDVVFAPGSSVALRDNSTIFASETAGSATVTVVRTGNTQERMTVEYTTNEIGAAGAAQAGVDYTQPTLDGRANTGQVVFEIGDTSKTFAIPIINDRFIEGNETFAIGLQNPSSGSLGAPRTTLITIVDDDSPSTISMSQAAASVSEGASTVTLTLQRSGNIDGTASVNYATANGTATAGADYTATSGTATFASGQLTQTISVPILNDIATESDETFTVTLSNPSGGAQLGSQTATAVTILDNDLTLGNLVRQTVVTGLSEPTALDWTPDGRYMFVAQQNGVVRLVDNGTLRSTPLVDLSSQVNYTPGDRGLLGFAVHPNFATTSPYVYLLHTYDPPETAGGTGLAGPDTQGNRPSRLVRLTVDRATMTADPGSLVVILGKNSNWAYTSRPDVNSNGNSNIPPSGIVNGSNNTFSNGLGLVTTVPVDQIDAGAQDNDPDRAGVQNLNIRDYLASDGDSHSNGAVQFGPDGWLYVSNGDGTSYNFMDPRSVRVQDIDNLSGKVLRINPDTGEGVPGNPFYEADDPNSNRSKVFYSGVRNAYRFTFDPVTNLPVLGDVGWTTWEEINTGAPGSNFGWPYLEGPNQTGGYQSLSQAIAFYDNGNRNNPGDPPAVFPILSRSHGSPDNATAITVGDFYNNNTLMFGDLINGNLYAATLNGGRQVTNVQVFDSNIQNIVDMEMGPDGRLYGVDLAAGSIRRWVDAGTTVGATLAAPV